MFGKFKLKNSNFAVQFRLKVVVNSQKHLLGSHVTSVVKYLQELMGIHVCWIWNSQNRNYQLISCDIEVVAVRKRNVTEQQHQHRASVSTSSQLFSVLVEEDTSISSCLDFHRKFKKKWFQTSSEDFPGRASDHSYISTHVDTDFEFRKVIF